MKALLQDGTEEGPVRKCDLKAAMCDRDAWKKQDLKIDQCDVPSSINSRRA